MKVYYTRDNVQNIDGFDRHAYPESIVRVTAGAGSDALLYLMKEKTVLIDCGMAYCADLLTENISEVLGTARTLDAIFITHSHYDHIGALSEVKRVWPKAIVYGSSYAEYTLKRKSTFEGILHMSNVAAQEYTGENLAEPLDMSRIQVEQILQDGACVKFGTDAIYGLETPGHTNCCMSFYLESEKVLILSESTGMVRGPKCTTTCVLKGFAQAKQSVERCRNFLAEYFVFPHYGIIPKRLADSVFETIVQDMEEKETMVTELYQQGVSTDRILDIYVKKYWKQLDSADVPFEAFRMNSGWEVKAILKTLKEVPAS